MAGKQVMNDDSGDLPGVLFERKQDICFAFQKAIQAIFILEPWGDLYVREGFGEQTHGLRQKIHRLAYHQADGDGVLIFGAEILSLFNGALQICPHTGEIVHELAPRRRQRGAFPAALEDGKAHFLLQQLDLIGEGGLTDKHVVSRPAEVQRPGKLNAVVNLFCGHNGLRII